MLAFHRRIEIRTLAGSGEVRARASLEDDFHHFRIELTARDGAIRAISGSAPRHPYTLCAHASSALQALVGTPCSTTAHAIMRATDASAQCTHLLELGGLAMAAAAMRIQRRSYAIEVPRRRLSADGVGQSVARLERDGQPLLYWELRGDLITAPATFAGVNLREGLARWALANLQPEDAEAALVLRRAAVISKGREYDLDVLQHARASGLCFAQQPERASQALRVVGSTLDFTSDPQALCAGDEAWLAMEDVAGVT